MRLYDRIRVDLMITNDNLGNLPSLGKLGHAGIKESDVILISRVK